MPESLESRVVSAVLRKMGVNDFSAAQRSAAEAEVFAMVTVPWTALVYEAREWRNAIGEGARPALDLALLASWERGVGRD